jgi:putative glutamine amidotransferase
MLKLLRLKFLLFALLIFLFLPAQLRAQAPERFFDTASETHQNVRLTIFYPSVGTVKALLALKEQGLLPSENIEVVGVYHAKEKTNYKESQKFIRDKNIAWVKFHEVSAEIGLSDLYKPNAGSKEFEEIFRKSDGMIFFGGPDIPPAAYKQNTNLLTIIEDPDRHYLELSFIFHLLGRSQNDTFKGFLESRPTFPVLGICLGSQSLSVGTGGTLVQDVWEDTYGKKFVEDIIALGQPNWHKNPWRLLNPNDKKLLGSMLHPIKLADKSKFCTELGFRPGDEPYIMSSHHQAAGQPGKGFKVAATSLDGKVIEAIEHTRFPNVLGTQFHPEFPILWDTEPNYKFTPQDKDLFSINGYLKAHPPSIEFHKKLWQWFFGKVKANHRG